MAINKRKSSDGKTRYQVRVKDPRGRWYRAETFERLIDAEKHERELMNLRDQGQGAATSDEREEKVKRENITFAEYWSYWSTNGRKCHDSWKMTQDQIYRDYLSPCLAERRLVDIRPQDIGKVLMRATQVGRAPQTVRHIYNLLHKIMNDAVEYYELLERNPVLRRDKPEVIETERDFLTPLETQKLREASKNHFLGPAIWLGTLCGLRPSEIQALTWSAVDLETRQLIIRAAYKRKVRRTEPFPKGKRWARVPIPPVLLEYLWDLKQSQGESEYVAPGLRGGMLKYEILLAGLRRLCKDAGVKPVSPHELRHSCSEEWVQAGASREDIARVLNHSSPRITERYMHRTDERLSAISEKVGVPFQSVTHLLHMRQKTG